MIAGIHRLIGAACLLAGIALPGLCEAQVASAAPPTVAGIARVWFLRQFQPGEGFRSPMIFVNGAPLATSTAGTAFYRDFPPGTYNFAVETCTRDNNQETTLTLPPGSETELEVQSLSSFRSWGCVANTTFYIRPIPPRWAQMYLPQLAYLGAR